MLPVRSVYLIRITYPLRIANPTWQGLQYHLMYTKRASYWNFPHSFANTHTRTWLASIRNENIAPFYVCLPAKSKHIMLPHTHRVRLALFAMNELQPTLDTHTKTHTDTHSHLSIHTALLFGFKNWISPWASFITLISRRHPQLIDQAFLAW